LAMNLRGVLAFGKEISVKNKQGPDGTDEAKN
jgi:hypothetical protein